MGKRGKKDGPGRAVLDRAYELARDKYPREVHSFASFRTFIGATSQNVNTWVDRGVPKGRLLSIADKIGVPVDSLRGLQAPPTNLGDTLTDQEAMLLAAFRQADEATRARMLQIARGALLTKLPEAPPGRATPIRRN